MDQQEDNFPKFGFGWNTPEDKICGLFGFWIDNYRTWALQVHLLVRRECWSWGFGRDEMLPDQFWIGAGPLFLICFGST